MSLTEFSKITAAAVLWAAVFALVFCTGCATNPYDSDMPWSTTNEWELSPNVPNSLRGN